MIYYTYMYIILYIIIFIYIHIQKSCESPDPIFPLLQVKRWVLSCFDQESDIIAASLSLQSLEDKATISTLDMLLCWLLTRSCLRFGRILDPVP